MQSQGVIRRARLRNSDFLFFLTLRTCPFSFFLSTTISFFPLTVVFFSLTISFFSLTISLFLSPSRSRAGQDIYWEAGEKIANLTFCLLDEAKRAVEMTPRLASHLKVSEGLFPGAFVNVTWRAVLDKRRPALSLSSKMCFIEWKLLAPYLKTQCAAAGTAALLSVAVLTSHNQFE